MALITFSGRIHAARVTNTADASRDGETLPATVLAFLKQVGRRLADAPLDSPVLQAGPVPRTQARATERSSARAVPRARVAPASLRQYWLPSAGPDGKVRLVAL
jgi:hypothetical protein